MYSVEREKIIINRDIIMIDKDGIKELVLDARNAGDSLITESLNRFGDSEFAPESLENIDPEAIELETTEVDEEDFLAYVNFPSVLKIDPVKNGDEEADSPDFLIPADIIAQLLLGRLQRDGVIAVDVAQAASDIAKSWLSEESDESDDGDLSLEVGVEEENIFLILEQETR